MNEWPKSEDLEEIQPHEMKKVKLSQIEWLHDVTRETYRLRMGLDPSLSIEKGTIGSEVQ